MANVAAECLCVCVLVSWLAGWLVGSLVGSFVGRTGGQTGARMCRELLHRIGVRAGHTVACVSGAQTDQQTHGSLVCFYKRTHTHTHTGIQLGKG